MIKQSNLLQNSRMVRSVIAMAILSTSAYLIVLTPPADARGHGFGGRGMHGAEFAGGHRRGNDSYIKAASDEHEKLLNTQLKSICRGC